jgi:hypothetical protein
MATSMNTPLTGEIWHLSIEDLLQPLPEAPRLGGPGPFVINLSASSAPISSPAKQLAEFTATAHVYQIQRTEDRRPRYRLRLGPFLTEDEAEALLAKVREIYPSALTATAESDDLRAISSLQTKAEALATGRHGKRTAAPSPAAPAPTSAPAPTLKAVPAGIAAVAPPGAPASANVPAMPAQRVATTAPTHHKPQLATSPPAASTAPVPPAPAVAPLAELRATPAPQAAQPAAPPPAGAAPQAAVPAIRAAAPPAIHAQPSARPQPVPATPPRAAAPASAPHPAPSRTQPASAPRPAMAAPTPVMPAPPSMTVPTATIAPPAMAASSQPVTVGSSPPVTAPPPPSRSFPQPLDIPVLSDTVSLVRRPPVRAAARRAVPPKAHTQKPIPVITHKVIPSITHKRVPTITEEVEFAPASIKTVSEAAAPGPLKPTTEAAHAVQAAAKTHSTPIAALKAEPAAPAPGASAIKPAAAPETLAPGPVKTAPAAPGAAPIKAVAARPAAAPVKPAAPAVKPACAAPASLKPMPHQPMPAPLKALLSPSARRVEALNEPLPNLESTQTLRPLTQLEMEDDTVSRWFVIQLSLAEESFDPDSLPNLDIFGEYRLYSVAGIDQGKVMHALRLGFFAEEGAAAAVASYLSAFYEKPTIKRISTAERDRFSDQRVEARMDVGATGRHAVIEITSERVVREKRTTATVMPMPIRPAGVAGGGAQR